jgi:hypothetical protein
MLIDVRGQARMPDKTARSYAEFLLLEYESSGGELTAVAALLFDPKADRLHVLSPPDCLNIADADDARALRLYLLQLREEARTRPGSAILEEVESALSNTVRITNRVPVDADALGAALGGLLAWRPDRSR